jgi:hypothetical protein
MTAKVSVSSASSLPRSKVRLAVRKTREAPDFPDGPRCLQQFPSMPVMELPHRASFDRESREAPHFAASNPVFCVLAFLSP